MDEYRTLEITCEDTQREKKRGKAMRQIWGHNEDLHTHYTRQVHAFKGDCVLFLITLVVGIRVQYVECGNVPN